MIQPFDYVAEVQEFIRGTGVPNAVAWLDDHAHLDFTLVLFHVGDKLVAVGAHERSQHGTGTHIDVIALDRDHRGAQLPAEPPEGDGHTRRLSTFVMDVLVRDGFDRGRGSIFTARVHRDNERSLGLCARYGFIVVNAAVVEAGLDDYYELVLEIDEPPAVPAVGASDAVS